MEDSGRSTDDPKRKEGINKPRYGHFTLVFFFPVVNISIIGIDGDTYERTLKCIEKIKMLMGCYKDCGLMGHFLGDFYF